MTDNNINENVLDNKIQEAQDPQTTNNKRVLHQKLKLDLNTNKSTSKCHESHNHNNFSTNCEVPERLSQDTCKEELENKLSQTYDEEIQSALNLQTCLVAEKMIRLQNLQKDLISYSSRQAYLYIISIAAKIEHRNRENNLFENSDFVLSSGNPRCDEYEVPTNFGFNFSDRSTNIRDISDDLTLTDSSDLDGFDTQTQRVLKSWFELFSRNS